jgi:hypothetical protein
MSTDGAPSRMNSHCHPSNPTRSMPSSAPESGDATIIEQGTATKLTPTA